MLQKIKNREAQAGFTLVELLIVIVVIAILAAIVITTFAGVQARARDTERQTDVKSVVSQLEVYHTNNGKYPTAAQMTAAADDVTTDLEGLSPEALTDPQGAAADNNHFAGSAPAAVGTYGYVPAPAGCNNGSASPAVDCASFTVSYYSEVDGAAVPTESLNKPTP